MREFSLLDVIKYYIRKIWIVVVTSFFAFLMGYFYVNEYFTPMYEESATIILGKSKGDKTESEMSYSTITLYDSLVNNYLQLLESNKLFYEVGKNLNLNYSESELSNMVEYSVGDTSQTITVTVKNSDDKEAVKICNEIINVLKDYVYDIYGLDNIMIVDNAVATSNFVYSKNTIIIYFVVASVIVSSFIIVLKYIFSNNPIKKRKKIEKINYSILGKVKQIIYPRDYTLAADISMSEKNSFRNIRVSLMNEINDNKVIMISSLNRNSTKSYVVYNLAQAIQKTDKEVLVIDANGRDGLITKTFLSGKKGLLDILDNQGTIDEVKTNIHGVDIIPLGDKDKLDLISSIQFESLIDTLKDEYDYIFVEGPCLKNNFEPVSILKITDATIIISKFIINNKNLNYLMNKIDENSNSLLGVILVRQKKKIDLKAKIRLMRDKVKKIRLFKDKKKIKKAVKVKQDDVEENKRIVTKATNKKKVASKKQSTVKKEDKKNTGSKKVASKKSSKDTKKTTSKVKKS